MSAVATAVAVGGYASNRSQSREARMSRESQQRGLDQSLAYLEPYRKFGGEELKNFENWLGTPGGQYTDPTTEEVLSSPGYDTRLGAVENSAAARGGLLSGNALRDIGEFGALEYDRTRSRRIEDYTNEYNRRMGRVNLGYGAAGGAAGIVGSMTPAIASTYERQGGPQMWDTIGSGITGAIGDYQGRKQSEQRMNMWQQYLDKL